VNPPLATIDFAGAQRWAKSSTGEAALGHHSSSILNLRSTQSSIPHDTA